MFRERFKSYPVNFLMLYAFAYMCNAIYNTFIPVYLNQLGFTKVSIGTLLAIGPFIALIAQPTWGIAGDRAATKNMVLKLLLLGSAIAVMLYPISSNYYYLIVIISTFTFFQTSIYPISDAITLEYLESTRWKFGPIRMGGTVGYAFMSILAGIVAKQNINNIFILFSIVAIFAFLSAFKLPVVKGHQSGGNKVAIWKLFKNRELVILMAFSFIAQTTMGFYYSFFPIYFRQMGADNSMLGLAMFISAMCEIPFLLFANKILDKLGTKLTLIISASVIAVRWLLLYSVNNVYLVLGISVLHGFSFAVLTYCMATYINREVPKELRASGQTMNGLISFGLARIAGSIFGGILSDMFGIRQVFLYVSLLDFVAVAVFGAVFIRMRAKKIHDIPT